MTSKQREIMAAWGQADDDFPEKSTEFIIAIICDRMGCDHSDVIDALAVENESTK
jgi:hypothetical protein